jgi:hypothetical protein
MSKFLAVFFTGTTSNMTTHFWQSEGISSLGTTDKQLESERESDFISFLELAQRLHFDFLPITWHPALERVGQGATSEIRQALITLNLNFAFKRVRQSRQLRSEKNSTFQTLVTELLVLGYPSIRNHPNMSSLYGICWDVSLDDGRVWPVFVFQKSEFGDLENFMKTDVGKEMSLENRLWLCADIATAVAELHSAGE